MDKIQIKQMDKDDFTQYLTNNIIKELIQEITNQDSPSTASLIENWRNNHEKNTQLTALALKPLHIDEEGMASQWDSLTVKFIIACLSKKIESLICASTKNELTSTDKETLNHLILKKNNLKETII